MKEKPRERSQFTLSARDCASFDQIKASLVKETGIEMSNAEVIRHCIAAMKKQLENRTDGR